jgi:hypothetical protein
VDRERGYVENNEEMKGKGEGRHGGTKKEQGC